RRAGLEVPVVGSIWRQCLLGILGVDVAVGRAQWVRRTRTVRPACWTTTDRKVFGRMLSAIDFSATSRSALAQAIALVRHDWAKPWGGWVWPGVSVPDVASTTRKASRYDSWLPSRTRTSCRSMAGVTGV